MKTTLIAIFVIAFIHVGYSQKSKTKIIIKNEKFVLLEATKYDEQNNITDIVYVLGGNDARYSKITSVVMIKSGTIIDIYNFSTKLQSSFFEEEGTTMEYDGQHVYVGKGILMVYGTGKDKDGYIVLNKKNVDQIVDESGKRF